MTSRGTPKVCPYIGLCNDRTTFAGFSNAANCCYRARPPASVRLSHQARFCLTSRHVKCPVFRRKAAKPLPRALRLSRGKNAFRVPWAIVIMIGAVALLGGVWWAKSDTFPGGALWPSPTPWPTPLPPSPTASPTATWTPLPTLTPSPTPWPSPTLPASPTPEPSLTPVPRALEVPLGPDGRFLIHQIQPEETWEDLAARYGTSHDALVAINALPLETMFREGLVIVVPLGITDPDALRAPPLQAYRVGEYISVQALAGILEIDDADLFEALNLCSGGDILRVGDWVLIPRFQAEP